MAPRTKKTTEAAPAPAPAPAPVTSTPAPVVSEKKPRTKKAAVATTPAAPAPVTQVPATVQATPAAPAAEKKSRKRPRTETAAAATATASSSSSTSTSSSSSLSENENENENENDNVSTIAAATTTSSSSSPLNGKKGGNGGGGNKQRSAVPYVPLPKIMDFSDEAMVQARQYFNWFARHATRNRVIRLYKDIALQVYNELRNKSQKVVDVTATNARYKERLGTFESVDFKSLHGKWLSDFSIKGKYTFDQARDLLVKQGKIEDDPKSARIGLLLAACTAHKVKPLGVISEARDVNKNYIVSLDADEAKRVYVGPTIMFKGLQGHKLAFDLRKDSVYVPRDKLPRGVRRVTSLFPATSASKKKIVSSDSADISGVATATATATATPVTV